MLFTITVTHASTADTNPAIDRTFVHTVDAAFNAAPMTYAIFEGLVEAAPASAVVTIVVSDGTTTVTFNAADDIPTFDGKFAQLDGIFYNVKKAGSPAAYL